MNLEEHQGKKLFKKHNLPVPEGLLLTNDNLDQINPFDQINSEKIVLKAQIPTGKRGKGGGILFVTEDEWQEKAAWLLEQEINGFQVDQIWAEAMLQIDQEIYLAITLDRTTKGLILIYCAEGGMEIEELSAAHPDKIVKLPLTGQADQFDRLPENIRPVAQKLLTMVKQENALLAEINPLVITADNQVIAADSKVIIDDNSLPPQEEETEYSYVELDGTIGVIGNGAGLVMASLDTLDYFGGQAANFLDIGGGANKERMFKAIDQVLSNQKVEGLLINIFGGITRCDQIAQGIVDYKQEKQIKLPLVVRLIGTNEQEGQQILSQAGIDCATEMNQAVKKIIELTN
ncbi:MAG: succinate--CoA ligase subunit beta [Candidatus Pacebacteria bacterium]|nr:succinate--CoA ligase subunit beta [Candidatus Paceibacterota bacterium]